MKRLLTTLIALLCCTSIFATEWHNPEQREVSPMQGICFQGEERESYLDKLPLRAKKLLSKSERAAVNNTNGVSVRFRTSSPNITVKCTMTSSAKEAAVQLYATDNNGGTQEIKRYGNEYNGNVGVCSFKDIKFNNAVQKNRGYDYQLWLPESGRVETLEIGVEDGAFFDFKDCREELPIVLYDCVGEGAYWSKGLSVRMDRPVISLSDSALKLLPEVEAKAYVLSGTPKKLAVVIDAANAIRRNHPTTPIVVSEAAVYEALTQSGFEDIHIYKEEPIFDDDASAFCAPKLREVLNCPMGEISTTQPVVQSRAGSIEWYDQCNCILRELRDGNAKSAVLGNSIVQNWIGDAPYAIRNGGGKVGRLGKESWERYMGDYINLGIGSDRVENLLWRVYNDQFEIVQFERIIIMIGTNNIKLKNTYDEIALGVDNLVHQIQLRQPEAEIIVVGVLPRKDMTWAEVQSLNAKVEPYVVGRGVKYVNVGGVLLDENDTPRDEFYGDGVHLSAKGYMVYGEALMGAIK